MGLNLASFLEQTARTYPDTTALILDDFRMSYSDLVTNARRVANILVERGVRHGDNVAIMLPNVPQFPIVYYGILMAGATVVPLNCMLRAAEIHYQLEDAEVGVFLAWSQFEEEATKAFLTTETCRHLITIAPPSETRLPNVGESFARLMAKAAPDFDTVQTSPDDTAAILYTSGTTGQSKGAELTHFNLFFNALCARDQLVQPRQGDVGLVVLPLFHCFGQSCIMNMAFLSGVTLTLLPTFDTEKTVEVIKRDHVTFMAAVPTMYYWILNLDGGRQFDLSSLRLLISGGSALPKELYDRFLQRFGLEILEGYGLTETSPVASFNLPNGGNRPHSIGRPIWGAEMRIRRDDGTFAGPEEVGEVVIRGHNVMKGYYNRPVATKDIMVDGWLLTGDLGKYDADGFFYIVDRKKDIVIRGGMNIYPRELEEVLYGHPDVLEVAVVGIADEARGEEVRAYVALRASASCTQDDLRTYCADRMARYKVPKEVVFLPTLPKGPTGKVLRRELRNL